MAGVYAQHDVVVCAASQGVYQAIKRNTWGQHALEVEQERIAWCRLDDIVAGDLMAEWQLTRQNSQVGRS